MARQQKNVLYGGEEGEESMCLQPKIYYCNQPAQAAVGRVGRRVD